MHTYISMHTQNTRIHLQRKPVMIDDNDDDDVLLTLLSLLQYKSDICVIATAKPNIYIPMHTQNTRIHLQRKPAMIDDNDDDDDAEHDIDDDEDDDDADDEDCDDEDDEADDDDVDEDFNFVADAAINAAGDIIYM